MTRVLTLAWAACAQHSASPPRRRPSNPLSAGAKRTYDIIKGYVIRSPAEKMPEEHYTFKASPDVRSFGQLVGHIADANFMFCGAAAADKPTPPGGGRSRRRPRRTCRRRSPTPSPTATRRTRR